MKPTEFQPLRTLDEMKDEFVGIRGTAEREAYEHALRMEVIGNQIKAFRKKRGMTQGDLGLLLGVQKAQISKLENGTHSATIDTILRAFRALNAEVLFQVRDLE